MWLLGLKKFLMARKQSINMYIWVYVLGVQIGICISARKILTISWIGNKWEDTAAAAAAPCLSIGRRGHLWSRLNILHVAVECLNPDKVFLKWLK